MSSSIIGDILVLLPQGGQCPEMKWWCGSEATPLVTPLSLCFCDSACVRGYQLKVKSSENRCTHYSIYWKSVMLPYIETLLFAFWNHLILKVPKENWVEKKNRRQVKNLQIYVPPKTDKRKTSILQLNKVIILFCLGKGCTILPRKD